MRIAVLNEISACAKNKDICSALEQRENITVLNLGMKSPDEKVPLTYIHTAVMSALLLNFSACDMVVGGCGTGQGYLNAVMQFPNVFCGLIQDPLDAWLFSQINAGNCISLALNKGYGWAADKNLDYILRSCFKTLPEGDTPRNVVKARGKSYIIETYFGKNTSKHVGYSGEYQSGNYGSYSDSKRFYGLPEGVLGE